MKPVSFLLLSLVAVPSFSQSLGTKKDVVSSVASQGPSVQPGDLVQMILALVIVAGLVKWVLPKLVGKLSRRVSTPLGSTIKVEEAATCGSSQLQVVTVRGRTLLLGLTSTGVNCLADLTVAAPQTDKPAFFDFLDQADPAKAVVTDAPEQELSVEDAVNLIAATQSRIQGNETPLDRLNRLTGLA